MRLFGDGLSLDGIGLFEAERWVDGSLLLERIARRTLALNWTLWWFQFKREVEVT
jgi:hypothetical protein